MADKYHNEWIIRDIVTDARIFKAQSRAFHFLSDMAYGQIGRASCRERV